MTIVEPPSRPRGRRTRWPFAMGSFHSHQSNSGSPDGNQERRLHREQRREGPFPREVGAGLEQQDLPVGVLREARRRHPAACPDPTMTSASPRAALISRRLPPGEQPQVDRHDRPRDLLDAAREARNAIVSATSGASSRGTGWRATPRDERIVGSAGAAAEHRRVRRRRRHDVRPDAFARMVERDGPHQVHEARLRRVVRRETGLRDDPVDVLATAVMVPPPALAEVLDRLPKHQERAAQGSPPAPGPTPPTDSWSTVPPVVPVPAAMTQCRPGRRAWRAPARTPAPRPPAC
ncbi:MAG: hypothetical protein U0869_03930 [Chloroflexota bacterium]